MIFLHGPEFETLCIYEALPLYFKFEKIMKIIKMQAGKSRSYAQDASDESHDTCFSDHLVFQKVNKCSSTSDIHMLTVVTSEPCATLNVSSFVIHLFNLTELS